MLFLKMERTITAIIILYYELFENGKGLHLKFAENSLPRIETRYAGSSREFKFRRHSKMEDGRRSKSHQISHTTSGQSETRFKLIDPRNHQSEISMDSQASAQ